MADHYRWGEGRYDEIYGRDRQRSEDFRRDDYGQPREQDRYRSSSQSDYGGSLYRSGPGRRGAYSSGYGDNQDRWREDRSFDQSYRYGGGYDPYRSGYSRSGEEEYRDQRYGTDRSYESDYRPPSNRAAADSMIHRPPYERGSDRANDWYRSDYERGRGDHDRTGRDQRGDDRSAWDRTRDEVSSWFGDNEAARRREMDHARDDREHHAGKGPKGYARSDDRIREDVNDRLTEDWLIDASEIEVQVSGGEVTLNGLVADRSDKRRAEDIADRISGVKHVQNNLRVRQSAQQQAFGRQTSDEAVQRTTDGDAGRMKTTN